MSNRKIACAISENNITVHYDGQTHIVARKGTLGEKLIKALKEGRKDDIPSLVSNSKRVEAYGRGKFVVRDGVVHVNDLPLNDILSRKILSFEAEGLPHEPLVKFASNLQKNPSFRAVNELFTFLEKNDHPITDDGNFIAYKKVRDDFKDVRTGTFDNSPGKVVEMPRNQVNEDSAQTCSEGLHAANYAYASGFYNGGVMLELEINPADVVSIPIDYDNAKMRVCKYKVLGVVDHEHSSTEQLRTTTQPPAGYPSCQGHDRDDEEDEEEEDCATCHSCGVEVDDCYDLCIDCENDEDEEEEEDDEEDDDYPFDRELD
jgi:hypothetical protein